MFDEIERQSHAKLQEQIDKLKEECERNADVAEMVRLIIQGHFEYSDYHHRSNDAKVGDAIGMFLYCISGISVCNSGNLNVSWASELTYFIGNFVYDDSYFDFTTHERTNVFTFKPSDDTGRYLQDPRIIIEAARANVEYYNKINYGLDGMLATHRAGHKVDPSKVLALLKENE